MSELRRMAASRLVASSSKKRGGSGYTTPTKGSRNSSRFNTDDEDNLDDDISMFSDDDWSVASSDTLDSYGTDTESSGRSTSRSRKKDTDTGIDWREKLGQHVDVISGERKNTSFSSREDALSRISKILSMKYAWRIVEDRHKDFEDGIIRSLKNGKSGIETILACRVLSLLVVTDPENEVWFTGVISILKNLIFSSDEAATKVACLYALGSVVFFSTVAGEEEATEILDFLLDIIVSDGSSIQAADDEKAVTATIQVFGFIASTLDDALEISQSAVPALVDQLESSQVSVRMASGQVIALLYERYVEDIGNYHLVDSSEEEDNVDEPVQTAGSVPSLSSPSSEDDKFESDDEDIEETQQPKRPQPKRTPSSQPKLYYDDDQLIYLLTQLSTSSSKRLAKSSRRAQHSMFRDILETVKTAIGHAEDDLEPDTMGYERPSMDSSVLSLSSNVNSNIHMTLRFEQGLTLSIDSWAAYLRLAHVRRILSHGLPVHYSKNRVVRLALDPLGATAYERARGGRSAGQSAGRSPEDEDIEPEDDDPRMKEVLKSLKKETKKIREEDIRKARNTSNKELFNRELDDWE
ncbi:interferon-related developmental regulator-domain-containing protein [Lipomyces tetrasporus]|uniref:Interferon-related developmental regulator-domain-containing protein n=1 Tax=Lipomyces tetrasporus TaxID=54092 RepID=A0AAD7VTA9_9ASCO|nr:interferon-related developmental regulator-domain-containing protein [Lipomyces tetrasporus]KAJ8101902.1 interferon-related developmental regulator-domain-containing protein [Lipomyces tetrasporus]